MLILPTTPTRQVRTIRDRSDDRPQRRSAAILLAILLGCGGCSSRDSATPPESGGGQQQLLDRFDVDKDGKLNQAERMAARTTLIAEVDQKMSERRVEEFLENTRPRDRGPGILFIGPLLTSIAAAIYTVAFAEHLLWKIVTVGCVATAALLLWLEVHFLIPLMIQLVVIGVVGVSLRKDVHL